MSTETSPHRPLPCPGSGEWLAWLSDRAQPDAWRDRADLQQHLDGCATCRATIDDVRRYQTLLLRGRPTALNGEERAALDERVFVSIGHWQPPPQTSPRLIWGTALALAAALAAVVGWPYVRPRTPNPPAVAAVPAASGLAANVLEGQVELAGKDGRWRPLTAAALLESGVRLRATSTARLVVPGRFELRLQPGAELETLAATRIDRPRQVGEAAFRLRSGEVDCAVEKRKPAQQFVLLFGAHRASVVGTRFTVRHPMDGSSATVDVTEGAVRVDDADDWLASTSGEMMTTVRAGQRWRQSDGRMALEPIPAHEPAAAPELAPSAATPPASSTRAAATAPSSLAEPSAPDAPRAKSPRTGPGKQRNILIEVPTQTVVPEEAGGR